jgi:hypothetical protein
VIASGQRLIASARTHEGEADLLNLFSIRPARKWRRQQKSHEQGLT